MEIPVKKLNKLTKNVRIEVCDQNFLGSEPLGHANVTLGLFCARGPCENRVELRFAGGHAGHLMVRSVFHTENVNYVSAKVVV